MVGRQNKGFSATSTQIREKTTRSSPRRLDRTLIASTQPRHGNPQTRGVVRQQVVSTPKARGLPRRTLEKVEHFPCMDIRRSPASCRDEVQNVCCDFFDLRDSHQRLRSYKTSPSSATMRLTTVVQLPRRRLLQDILPEASTTLFRHVEMRARANVRTCEKQ